MSWSSADTRRWAPAVVLMALIFVMSSIPGSGIPPAGFIGVDKLIHAAVYALLGALLVRATGRPLWAVVLAAAYGVSDELHQALVPGRFADVYDAIADAVGAALGVASWKLRPGGSRRTQTMDTDDGDHPQLQGNTSENR